jgi:hypothetical protein
MGADLRTFPGMKIDGVSYRSVWLDSDGWSVNVFDQTKLPWQVEVLRLTGWEQAAHAIRSMQVRGAPLIGAVAAYGVALAMRQDPSKLDEILEALNETRPTAINLRWALDRQRAKLHNLPLEARAAAAYAEAAAGRRRRCRDLPPHRRERPAAAQRDRREEGPGERAHPLQRRLARDGRLGHGALARSTRRMTPASRPCLGGRDPPAQPGRRADGLRAGRAWRAAHGDRRQCRRPL